MNIHNSSSSIFLKNNLITMVDLPKQVTMGYNNTVAIKLVHLFLWIMYVSLVIS